MIRFSPFGQDWDEEPFVKVPNKLSEAFKALNIAPAERWVIVSLAGLRRETDNPNLIVAPLEVVVKRAGLSKPTVLKSIERLAGFGLIIITRGDYQQHIPNRYDLTPLVEKLSKFLPAKIPAAPPIDLKDYFDIVWEVFPHPEGAIIENTRPDAYNTYASFVKNDITIIKDFRSAVEKHRRMMTDFEIQGKTQHRQYFVNFIKSGTWKKRLKYDDHKVYPPEFLVRTAFNRVGAESMVAGIPTSADLALPPEMGMEAMVFKVLAKTQIKYNGGAYPLDSIMLENSRPIYKELFDLVANDKDIDPVRAWMPASKIKDVLKWLYEYTPNWGTMYEVRKVHSV